MALKLPTIFFIIFSLFTLNSCDTVKTYTDKAWSGLGFGDEEPKEKSLTKKDLAKEGKRKTPRPKTPKNVPAQVEDRKEPEQNSIVVNAPQKKELQRVEKKDLKLVDKPEFSRGTPVHVYKRVGGAAVQIRSDEKFIYIDFPMDLKVYDHDLNLLARLPRLYPIRDVTRAERGDQTYLYLREENDVMEIWQLIATPTEQGQGYTSRYLLGYEDFKNFAWTDEKSLVWMVNKETTLLDFSDLNHPMETSLPFSDVSHAFATENALYLARKGFLDVLDLKTLKLLSSLKIGREFRFLGVMGKKPAQNLVISFEENPDVIREVQYLKLAEGGAGIADFGPVVVLEKPLTKFSVDFTNALILGQELGESDSEENASEPVRLYSLAEKRFLRGDLAMQTKLTAWWLENGKLYLSTPLEISVNALTLNEDVIRQSPEVNKLLSSGTPPPLAGLGSPTAPGNEYEFQPTKKIEFMADARKVTLLDKDHFAVFEKHPSQDIHQVFSSTNFASDDFALNEVAVQPAAHFDKILPTYVGLFAYADATKTIYFSDVELKHLEPIPVANEPLISWAIYRTTEADKTFDVLLVASQIEKAAAPALADKRKTPAKKTPPPKNPPAEIATEEADAAAKKPELKMADASYVVRLYAIGDSVQNITLLSEIPFKEKSFAVPLTDDKGMTGEILVLNSGGLHYYDVKDARKPMPSTNEVESLGKAYDFVAVKPFHINYRIYSLIREKSETGGERLKVLVFPLNQPEKNVVLEDFDLTEENFDGSTVAVSSNGQLLILPTDEGTLFYRMKELDKIAEDQRKVAHWEEPASYVDLASGGGQYFLCAALGAQGVSCGDLLSIPGVF